MDTICFGSKGAVVLEPDDGRLGGTGFYREWCLGWRTLSMPPLRPPASAMNSIITVKMLGGIVITSITATPMQQMTP